MRVDGGAAFVLSKRGVEVVPLADKSAFACIKSLGDGLKVNECPKSGFS